MIIEIMGRQTAIRYSREAHEETSAVISITDADLPTRFRNTKHPELRNDPSNGIKALCRLRFDDVEANGENGISDEDAQEIVSFVNTVAVKLDKLIVHCEAGVSRSAGVAAAIMKAVNNDDGGVFGNRELHPNLSCYEKVLEAFGIEVDEIELAEKIRRQGNDQTAR